MDDIPTTLVTSSLRPNSDTPSHQHPPTMDPNRVFYHSLNAATDSEEMHQGEEEMQEDSSEDGFDVEVDESVDGLTDLGNVHPPIPRIPTSQPKATKSAAIRRRKEVTKIKSAPAPLLPPPPAPCPAALPPPPQSIKEVKGNGKGKATTKGKLCFIKAPKEKLFCICRKPEKLPMTRCDCCKEWFHWRCIGMRQSLDRQIHTYFCNRCITKSGGAKQMFTIKGRPITIEPRATRTKMTSDPGEACGTILDATKCGSTSLANSTDLKPSTHIPITVINPKERNRWRGYALIDVDVEEAELMKKQKEKMRGTFSSIVAGDGLSLEKIQRPVKRQRSSIAGRGQEKVWTAEEEAINGSSAREKGKEIKSIPSTSSDPVATLAYIVSHPNIPLTLPSPWVLMPDIGNTSSPVYFNLFTNETKDHKPPFPSHWVVERVVGEGKGWHCRNRVTGEITISLEEVKFLPMGWKMEETKIDDDPPYYQNKKMGVATRKADKVWGRVESNPTASGSGGVGPASSAADEEKEPNSDTNAVEVIEELAKSSTPPALQSERYTRESERRARIDSLRVMMDTARARLRQIKRSAVISTTNLELNPTEQIVMTQSPIGTILEQSLSETGQEQSPAIGPTAAQEVRSESGEVSDASTRVPSSAIVRARTIENPESKDVKMTEIVESRGLGLNYDSDDEEMVDVKPVLGLVDSESSGESSEEEEKVRVKVE